MFYTLYDVRLCGTFAGPLMYPYRKNSFKNSLSISITFISKAILLLWFYLFYVLESFFVRFEPYIRFHSLR